MKITWVRWNDASEYEDDHEEDIENDDVFAQESVGILFKETEKNIFICRDIDQDGSLYRRIRIPKEYIIEQKTWEIPSELDSHLLN